MKKIIYVAMLLLGLSMMTSSCFSSPESLAKKDAQAMNKAVERNDAKAMEEAGRASEKHLNKYSDDRDKYFRYVDTYKNELK